MTHNDVELPLSPQSTARWQPPSDYVRVPSDVPGIHVYAPAPEEPAPERRTFKCPQCGASTAYSAAQAALTCAHCGYTEAPDAAVVGRQAQEAEFEITTLQQSARGWGRARRDVHCESCGADISLEATDLATTCSFCGSTRMITRQETQEGMLRPGFLIPFQVDHETGAALLREWLKQGWMHPPELHRVAKSAHLSGVYFPFWTFSARLDTKWQAEVGHRRTRTTLSGERKTEIKWEWKSGRLNVRVDDMLVPGTTKASSLLVNRLYPFDLSALTVYEPAYLAGWRAHAYDVGLRSSWDLARSWMRERAKEAAGRDIKSRHVRNFGMTADLEDERWRFVLLPVFLVAYRYRGKAYQVLVNGQTGQIAGQKPVAWRRVAGVLALLLLLPLLLIAVSGLLPENLGGLSACTGVGAFVAGIALAWHVLRRAIAADDA